MEFSYADMNNTDLEAHARNLHGALYRRINTLQRDLNIANETIKNYVKREKNLKEYITELEAVNNDYKKMVKRESKPLFPETPKPIVYKLEPVNDILTQEVIYRLVPKE